MELQLIEKINFVVDQKHRAVELYYGDITNQPLEQKVDLLLVSAFHGDYTLSPSSLIGALYKKYGLHVGNLAKDKEEDLRKNFLCWWSRPLSQSLPFRRILCFESSRSGETPQQAVAYIFKALVAASAIYSENGTIMSPLLSTGDQGFGEKSMLEAIVSNAITWIKNGLDITCFKLVVYRGNQKMLDAFRAIKEQHNISKDFHDELDAKKRTAKNLSADVTTYDFYISASKANNESVEQVKKLLTAHKPDLKFYVRLKRQEAEGLFEVMKKCNRVVTFLSLSYLNDEDCMMEFNAAWCLSRSQTSGVPIAPLLCETVPNIPTYMSLVQWVDIRQVNGSSEKMLVNINYFIHHFVKTGSDEMSRETSRHELATGTDETKAEEKNDQYDLFISYAHPDRQIVKRIIELLRSSIKNVKIFIDQEDLHTGGSWQQTLYHALESSRSTLACISPAYMKSKMCAEEFRLSLARHYTEADYQLVPIEIVTCSDLPATYSFRKGILMNGSLEERVINMFIPALKEFLRSGGFDGVFFEEKKDNCSLSEVLREARCVRLANIIKQQPITQSHLNNNGSITVEILSSKIGVDVEIAQKMKIQLCQQGFNAETRLHTREPSVLLSKLDHADIIIALMSTNFITDNDAVEGLQVAINRHRYTKDGKAKLYPVLLTDNLKDGKGKYHLYFDLLCYETSLSDDAYCTKNLDEVMSEHPNYKSIVRLCSDQQNSSEEDAQVTKFVGVVCNRVAYYATTVQTSLDVFADLYQLKQGNHYESTHESNKEESEEKQEVEEGKTGGNGENPPAHPETSCKESKKNENSEDDKTFAQQRLEPQPNKSATCILF